MDMIGKNDKTCQIKFLLIIMFNKNWAIKRDIKIESLYFSKDEWIYCYIN